MMYVYVHWRFLFVHITHALSMFETFHFQQMNIKTDCTYSEAQTHFSVNKLLQALVLVTIMAYFEGALTHFHSFCYIKLLNV